MPNPKVLLWSSLLVFALAALGRHAFTPLPPTTHVVLLDDRSSSTPDDCDSLAALGRRALSLPNVRARSTLALFATTDLDPSFVASFNLPAGKLSTESARRQVERENAFVDNIKKRCRDLPRTETSPVFRSIKAALAHLRAVSAAGRPAAYLFARTDLQETAEPAIQNALNGRNAGKLPILDNTGVYVTICGLGESLDEPAYDTDRVQAVWRGLFAQPEFVRFELYCPKLPAAPQETR